MSFPRTSMVGNQSSTNNAGNGPLVLNTGQMIHGQIRQLYPEQMAEIKVGSHTMLAKLEVPMKAGDSYYFHVQSIEPEVQLKIIAGPTGVEKGQSRQLDSLIEAMQLPKSSEMKALISFIVDNKIPMTREGLIQAETLIKNVPVDVRNEALASIQKLVQLKLPFTETLFRSLLSVETKEGLHSTLATLRNTILSDGTVSASSKSAILSVFDKLDKPFAQVTGSVVLGQSIMMLLDQSQSRETRFALVQLLKSVGLFPEHTSLANLQQVLSIVPKGNAGESLGATEFQRSSQISTGNIPEVISLLRELPSTPITSMPAQLERLSTLIATDTGLNSQNKESLAAIVKQAIQAQPFADGTTRFIQQLSEAFLRAVAENMLAEPLGKGGALRNELLTLLGQEGQSNVSAKLAALVRNAESSNNVAIGRLIQSSEGIVVNAIEGTAIKEAIQTVVRSLGLNYEAALLGKDPNVGSLVNSLKPQLIALMQDPTVSVGVRESAELAVMRMNAPLLLSGENGVQHQLVTQVPLDFFGKRIDATLQWNGRMKDDGKIDPDFARILFYLDLHSLHKTVVDMQVQNRIVSVTIFNADPILESIGAPLQAALKNGLDSTGYKLSGVHFKEFEEINKTTEQPKEKMSIGVQGVDFRI